MLRNAVTSPNVFANGKVARTVACVPSTATPLTEPDAAIAAFAEPLRARLAGDPHGGLVELAAALLQRMPYIPGGTDAATAAPQAFANGHGVCQDHAQVFIACLRLLGLPARYVSGYLATDAEHVASHAWAEVRLPEGRPTGVFRVQVDARNEEYRCTLLVDGLPTPRAEGVGHPVGGVLLLGHPGDGALALGGGLRPAALDEDDAALEGAGAAPLQQVEKVFFSR